MTMTPAPIPIKLNTTCTSVNVDVVIPQIMCASFEREPMLRLAGPCVKATAAT